MPVHEDGELERIRLEHELLWAAVQAADALPREHSPMCRRWKIAGDPLGRVSINHVTGVVESTARPWKCFCGVDRYAAARAALRARGEG